MHRPTAALAALLLLPAAAAADVPVTLRGSPESMERQHRVARDLDYRFFRLPAEIARATDAEYLVPLEGNRDYDILPMSHPVARPEVRLFVERLAAQFRAACGDRLVVTSLTRAASRQPANAHPLSVHPAGMAVDLRVPRTPACRAWLDRTLLEKERRGVIDATREQRPPHYHVAVFPREYLAYVAERVRLEAPLPALVDPALSHAALTEPTGPARVEDVAGAAAGAGIANLAPSLEPAETEERQGWLGRVVTRVLRAFRLG